MNFLTITHWDRVFDPIVTDGYDYERSVRLEDVWHRALLRTLGSGSAGVVLPVEGYGPYLPHVGTSPSVFDIRSLLMDACVSRLPHIYHRPACSRAHTLSAADQVREVLGALSLNKTDLAQILGVSRPTLYDWLDGKEPNPSNAQRLSTLHRLLASAGVTSATPLSPRFVRLALNEGEPSLAEALSAESLDEQLVGSLIRSAKMLGERAQSRRVAREDRLRTLGFEEPSEEQRREQLALNVAMLDWPKR